MVMVGLGRIELPTSPLSGVRSSQLSYRPAARQQAGGAGRDRTGDLLNANQALSQLSYSPKINLNSRPIGCRTRGDQLTRVTLIPSETLSKSKCGAFGLERLLCCTLCKAPATVSLERR